MLIFTRGISVAFFFCIFSALFLCIVLYYFKAAIPGRA